MLSHYNCDLLISVKPLSGTDYMFSPRVAVGWESFLSMEIPMGILWEF